MKRTLSALTETQEKRFGPILQMQKELVNITQESYPRVRKFVDNEFSKHPDFIESLARQIYIIAYIKPNLVPILSRLTASIFKSIKPKTNMAFFPTAFWSEITKNRKRPPHFYFIKQCMLQGAFSFEEIYDKLMKWPRETKEMSIFEFFATFAQEVQLYDGIQYTDFYCYLKENVRKLSNGQRAILEQWPQLVLNEYEGFKFLLQHGCIENSIQAVIKFDNIDRFREFTAQPGFKPDQTLLPNPFDYALMLRNGPTLLHYAAYFGSLRCYRHLVRMGASYDTRDAKGRTIWDFALAGGNEKILESLEKHNVSPGPNLAVPARMFQLDTFVYRYNSGKYSVSQVLDSIHECARSGNLVNMRQLLDVGVDINHQTGDGYSLLLDAVSSRMDDIVFFLLSFKSLDINKSDESGTSALHAAALNGDTPVVRALIERGADVHARTKFSNALPIHNAADGGEPEVVRMLISADPSSVNEADFEKMTPLMIAAEAENEAAVLVLLQAEGLDLSLKDNDGRTALIIAIDQGFTTIAEEILWGDPSLVNQKDDYGRTALHAACELGDREFVKLLLKVPDIDTMATDNEGKTPVEMAKEEDVKEVFLPVKKRHRKHKKQ